MNAILYGNLSAEFISGKGVRLERVTLRLAPPDAYRPRLPEPLPRPTMLGRERQSAEALAAIQAGRPAGFHAACGYGKTTLLQDIVAEAQERGTAELCVSACGPGSRRRSAAAPGGPAVQLGPAGQADPGAVRPVAGPGQRRHRS